MNLKNSPGFLLKKLESPEILNGEKRDSKNVICYLESNNQVTLFRTFKSAVTVGETEGAMDSASVLFFTSSFAYNFARE